MDLKKIAIKGTTQQHLPIEDIKKDLVILKDGSCILVLKTSSVNFNLLSEREQEAMIYAYAATINSLTFPVQILIRSALKDVSVYVDRLRQQEAKPIDPLIKKQIISYRKFVEEVVKKNNVLTKSFYLIIPFYSIELGIESAAKTSLPFPLSLIRKQSSRGLPMEKGKIIEKAYNALEPKRDHLARLFGRIGLNTKQLTTKELIQLFYQIYNQESVLVGNSEALSQGGAIIKTVKSALKKQSVEVPPETIKTSPQTAKQQPIVAKPESIYQSKT